jgi:predicted acyltransferase
MSVAAPRFRSLDVFRGLTVCFMIIVNTPGNYDTTYAPLLHAHWHGFTPTDLVFPSFLFAVGNALSFVAVKWQSMKQQQVLLKIFKRSFLIFLLGYLMYWFPFVGFDEQMNLHGLPFKNTRVFGVLQRIALCYMIAALLFYYLKERTVYILAAITLLMYWFVMLFFGDGTDPLSMQSNAALKLDLWLIGSNHLYKGEGFPFDPEGFLSTFPAAVNVIAGYWVGKYVQNKRQHFEMLSKLLLFGLAMFALGYVWDWFFPINKKLWTSSYVCYTVGLSTLILAVVMYVIDFIKKQSGALFFEVFGKNPLFIYLLSEVLVILLWFIPISNTDGTHTALYQVIYKNVFQPAGAYFGSFLFAIVFMLFNWLVGYLLHKKKIYIKV